MRSVAAVLELQPELGDGIVARVCRDPVALLARARGRRTDRRRQVRTLSDERGG
jgi:hypothetical protein